MQNMKVWEGLLEKIREALLSFYGDDLTSDAKVLIDQGNVFSREMDVLRRRLQELGALPLAMALFLRNLKK